MSVDPKQLQRIPAVDSLLLDGALADLRDKFAHETMIALIREAVDLARSGYLAGDLTAEDLDAKALVTAIQTMAAALIGPPLRKVINATGVILHTNLGRSPLSAGTQEAVSGILGGYSNLEIDLTTGKRTSRLGRVRDLLRRVTGADDAFAVNNNAAAVFLAVKVLAEGKEVLVSRGELVEIGGSFRLPDIMAEAGCILKEVGTTNKTRISDFRAGITADTAMILKAHPSNFVISGYTEAADSMELARLAAEKGIVFVEDLGSGALAQHPDAYLADEPRIQSALANGVDLLTFSGDKLLGGPQAGIILGKDELIEKLRKNPLARILRLDKLHLAALEATLVEYLAPDSGLQRIPLYRMISCPVDELRKIAELIKKQLSDEVDGIWQLEIVETMATVGGGSLPGESIPSVGMAISVEGHSLERFVKSLRQGVPAIVGRIEQDRLVLDMRTLLGEQWASLACLLSARMSDFTATVKTESDQGTAEV